MPRPSPPTAPARCPLGPPLAALGLALAGCTGESGPAPQRPALLASDPSFAALERSIEVRPGHTLELRLAAGSTRLEVHESFEPGALEAAMPGVWTLKPSLRRGAESTFDGLQVTLDGGAFRPLAALSDARSAALSGELPDPGTFADIGHLVLANAGPGSPPQRAELRYRVELGSKLSGTWRVTLEQLAADGWLLPPAGADALVLERAALDGAAFDTPRQLLLRAASLAEFGSPLPPASLDLRLDGQPHASFELGDTRATAWTELRVDLPARWSTLHVDVRGAFPVALVDPRWVLAPERDAPPDVLVFVADTFRADRLRAYAGAPATPDWQAVPQLDAFADSGTVFTRSWSAAPWTLPSQASLLTGWLPREHGATAPHRAFDDGEHLLARVFAAAGYRTVAVTDALYLEPSYGFDAGFEWFDAREEDGDVEQRLRAALDTDDGRPVFAFVQTYQAHTPYTASPGARSALDPEGRVGLEGDSAVAAFDAALAEAQRAGLERPLEAPQVRAQLAALEQLYTLGTWDLDQLFGRTLSTWRGRPAATPAIEVFTSDHGEAFGEHGHVFHTGAVYDEQSRVPLVIAADDLPRGRRDDLAWGLDLAPTLADLAGLEAHPSWRGRSLRTPPDAGRALWLDQALFDSGADARGLVDGRWKVLRNGDEQSLEIYDLGADPLELTSRTPNGPAAEALVERFLDQEDERMQRAPSAGRSLNLGPRARLMLENMGYVTEPGGE